MSRGRLAAFIDESGVRATTPKSSDHFVLSAVVVSHADIDRLQQLLEQLRGDLGRRPGDHLSWKNLKTHSERLHVAQQIGDQEWLRISSVVVCKRYLDKPLADEDKAYLFTLRLLLERLSWLARTDNCQLDFTLAHIVRFKTEQLRQYEARLKTAEDCQVDWSHLDPRGGAIKTPQLFEPLQVADLVASAIAPAFNPDKFGNTEQRYLTSLQKRFYRRGSSPIALTSYGLKMLPWNENTRAAYPWVAAL